SNQVSYTFTAGNGFSAIIAAEQGSCSYAAIDPVTGLPITGTSRSYQIDDY
ncbi:porin, partial [Enterobacter hormaechei]|uniref:porin n=1 Tax=Enterobacter hormaechei TaxID=158836 RepID=UPI003A5BD222